MESIPGVCFPEPGTPLISEADQISQMIRQADPTEMIVVFAHRDESRLLCRDGSALDLSQLPLFSPQRRAPVIVLTCDSIDVDAVSPRVATTDRLSFEWTADALHAAIPQFADTEATVSDVLIGLNSSLVERSDPIGDVTKGIVVTFIGSTVAGMIVVTVRGSQDSHAVERANSKQDAQGDRKKGWTPQWAAYSIGGSRMIFGVQMQSVADVVRAWHYPLDAGTSKKSELKAKFEHSQQITRVAMQVIVSLLLLAGSFLMIVIHPDKDTTKLAYGAIGVVSGYWLR